MDWRLYHDVNLFVAHHAWLGRAFHGIESWGVLALAAATFALWLLARPGGGRKWKLASASALASASLALLVNQAVARIHHRLRPYQAHGVRHLWTSRSADASFPSDHASAAFAIAATVVLFDRLVGSLFVAAAGLIALGRLVVGAHYPSDLLAGALVGTGCAVLVVRLGAPLIARLVRLAERVTDPLLRPVWRLARR